MKRLRKSLADLNSSRLRPRGVRLLTIDQDILDRPVGADVSEPELDYALVVRTYLLQPFEMSQITILVRKF